MYLVRKLIWFIVEFLRKTYDAIATFLFKVILLLPLPVQKGRLLIVRPDAIGDYILFRNYLWEIKGSEKYKDHEIYLLGNREWKNIALCKEERRIIQRFFWLDWMKFISDPNYQIRLAGKLRLFGFETVIYPCYSRKFKMDKFIHQFNLATYKIASVGDLENSSQEQKDLSDKFYDLLIPAQPLQKFEFDRNNEFFSILLKKELNTSLSLSFNRSVVVSDYLVLFPYAGNPSRCWAPVNFALLANAISEMFNIQQVYICGSSSDNAVYESIKANTVGTILLHNKVNQTSLNELIDIIGNARILISNETSAVHIGAATNTPVICISNGNHFLRFNPYDDFKNNILTVYPADDFYGDRMKYNLPKSYVSSLNINTITPESVIGKVRIHPYFSKQTIA